MASTHLSALMHKEVSRKEFVTISILAVASLFGFGAIIKLFTGKSLGKHKILNGYTNSSYGG